MSEAQSGAQYIARVESLEGFDWLFDKPEGRPPQYEAVRAIRNYFENEIRRTRSTFKVPDLLDGIDTEHTYYSLDRTFIPMIGAWVLPETISGGGDTDGATRYVNPKWKHRQRYSDVIARCECGTLVTYQGNGSADAAGIAGSDGHEDDCRPSWRLRARAKVAEKRRAVMTEMFGYGFRGGDVAKRIRVSTNTNISLHYYTDAYNVPYQRLLEEFAQSRANALVRLTPRIGVEAAGEVFGIARSTTGNIIRQETPFDVPQLTDMTVPDGYGPGDPRPDGGKTDG